MHRGLHIQSDTCVSIQHEARRGSAALDSRDQDAVMNPDHIPISLLGALTGESRVRFLS